MPELKERDTICIVAPAGRLKPEDILPTIDKLEKRGYHVELGKNIFQDYFNGYHYAGTTAERIMDMQWALDHPSAKAIWCARGGYGGVQLIDSLDWENFHKNPKWIIGYSDNTVFHQYLSLKQIPSLHGMTVKLLSPEQTEDSFSEVLEILQRKKLKHEWQGHEHNKSGNVKAPLSGGNLSIIYSLIHSNSIDHFKDKILFIEDWQEAWYHLDRMLMGLLRSGTFDEIAGLVVGSFTKMDDKEDNPNYGKDFDPTAYHLIAQHFKDFDIPKAFGLPAGHINNNRPLILGQKAELTVKKNGAFLKM